MTDIYHQAGGQQEAWAVHYVGESAQHDGEDEARKGDGDSDDSDSDRPPPPRIVTRIHTQDPSVFLLHCTCGYPTQYLLPANTSCV